MTENADFHERDSDDDQLEQLQPEDTLIDRGVADVLDEVVRRVHPSAAPLPTTYEELA